MRTKVWIHSVQVALTAITVVLSLDCRKDEDNMPNPTENKQAEKVITAASGGTLTTSDSVKLVIPPYALPMDGKVFIGRTGNEPSSVPNKNLKIEGKPITMRLPSDSILKPIQLSFPRPSSSIDTNNYSVFLFNGSTYFPMEWSLTGTKVIVSIDKINWEMSEKKGAVAEYIVNLLTNKAPPAPSALEMGLKKVSIRSGTMYFESPTASSSSKVLLLVHGLMGGADTWNVFLPKIVSETNPKYSEFWTFVYSSSWSIKSNAKLLAAELKRYAKGAQIDIIAHSMGGLVSRSAIEQFDGAQYINKLITLGTPHKGSPLAALRYVVGAIVCMKKPYELYYDLQVYNYSTQGVRDLNTNSKFIEEIDGLNHFPVSYFTIAAIADHNAIPRNELETVCKNITYKILLGLDDGVVSVSSAKGVQGAMSPSSDITIPVILAHLEIPGNNLIYQQVLDFLRLGSPNGTVTDIDGNVYKTVKIGSQWWMAENLKTTKYRNGNPIPNVTDNTQWGNLTTGAYCNYNNDINYVNTYGRLYNWYAVSDSRNIAPVGWHVPTDAEWTTLTTYLGGESVAGGKLKESGTAHWSLVNAGATNETGFTALPGGYRDLNGICFNLIACGGFWWSSTEYDTNNALSRYMADYLGLVLRGYYGKTHGFSVRCVKD